jgi:hypothetical protein
MCACVCVYIIQHIYSDDTDAAELRCWHSTSIVRRVDARALLTATGTKYILVDSIDRDEAKKCGM